MYNFKVGISISFIGYRSNQLLILFFNSNFNVMYIVSCFGAFGNWLKYLIFLYKRSKRDNPIKILKMFNVLYLYTKNWEIVFTWTCYIYYFYMQHFEALNHVQQNSIYINCGIISVCMNKWVSWAKTDRQHA